MKYLILLFLAACCYTFVESAERSPLQYQGNSGVSNEPEEGQVNIWRSENRERLFADPMATGFQKSADEIPDDNLLETIREIPREGERGLRIKRSKKKKKTKYKKG